MLVVDWKKRIDWATLIPMILEGGAVSGNNNNQENQRVQLTSKPNSSNLGNLYGIGHSLSSNPLLNFLSPHPLGINKDLLNIIPPSTQKSSNMGQSHRDDDSKTIF